MSITEAGLNHLLTVSVAGGEVAQCSLCITGLDKSAVQSSGMSRFL